MIASLEEYYEAYMEEDNEDYYEKQHPNYVHLPYFVYINSRYDRKQGCVWHFFLDIENKKMHVEPDYLVPSFFVIINNDSFNSLSPDLQKVIEDSIEWGAADAVKTMADTQQSAIDFTNSVGGHEFIDMSADELQRWYDLIGPVQDKWAKELDAQGLPGTEMKEFIRERLAAYTK